MWLRLARRRITLPVPVSRNRFPAPLWVFIFGMVAVVSVSLSITAVFTAACQSTQQSPSPALALSGHCRRGLVRPVLLPARPDPVPRRRRRRVHSPQAGTPLSRLHAGWALTWGATPRSRVPRRLRRDAAANGSRARVVTAHVP